MSPDRFSVETVRTRVKRGIAALRKMLRAWYGDGKRALPLALVFLAEAPARAAPAALGVVTAVALVTVLAGAVAAGVVALAQGSPVSPDVPPPPSVESAALPVVEPPDSPLVQEPTDDPKLPTAEFPGMAAIPAGTFAMGIDEDELRERFRGPNAAPWWNLMLVEAPRHEAVTEAYAIDRWVVTNAQYLRFLENEAKGTFVTTQRIDTLAEVAREIRGGKTGDLDEWQEEVTYWHNEKALLARWKEIRKRNAERITVSLDEFNEFRPDYARVRNFRKLPDKQRARAWVHLSLPEGIDLAIYRRNTPDHWPMGVPTAEQLPQPVVWVSWDDAAAFAEWAGKHIPTEQEWEKAARGPNGFLYPWGNTWDRVKEKNLIVWAGADSPPAAKFKDRAVDARSLKRGVSPYGVYNMLGNVREWTSSPPRLYPGSTAKREQWFGRPDFRVVRSTSYGDGQTMGKGADLVIRNTARAMHGPGGGIGRGQRFGAVGFRCAKYTEPAREVVAARIARLRDDGVLPERMRFAPRRTLGTEKTDYAPTGEVAPNGVIVRGRALAIGFVPSRERLSLRESDRTFLLGYLYWNADVRLVLGGEEHLPSHPRGYVVVLREGGIVLLRAPFRLDSVAAALPDPVDAPWFSGVKPADAPPGLSRDGGKLILRVDYGEDPNRRRLTLPLTFEGPELPDKTWR